MLSSIIGLTTMHAVYRKIFISILLQRVTIFLNCFKKSVAEKPSLDCIAKTRLYNLDPLKPRFYLVKLGFTGVYTIFLISA